MHTWLQSWQQQVLIEWLTIVTLSVQSCLLDGEMYENERWNVSPLKRKGNFTPIYSGWALRVLWNKGGSWWNVSAYNVSSCYGPEQRSLIIHRWWGTWLFTIYNSLFIIPCDAAAATTEPSLSGSKDFFGTVRGGHRDRVDKAYRIPSSHPCSPSPCGSHLYFSGENKQKQKTKVQWRVLPWIDDFPSCCPPHHTQRCLFFEDGTKSALLFFFTVQYKLLSVPSPKTNKKT